MSVSKMLEIDVVLSVREVRACPPSPWMVVDSVTDIRGRLTMGETGYYNFDVDLRSGRRFARDEGPAALLPGYGYYNFDVDLRSGRRFVRDGGRTALLPGVNGPVAQIPQNTNPSPVDTQFQASEVGAQASGDIDQEGEEEMVQETEAKGNNNTA